MRKKDEVRMMLSTVAYAKCKDRAVVCQDGMLRSRSRSGER